jgi:hypothetical protein
MTDAIGKRCPWCAEQVEATRMTCPHCGRSVTQTPRANSSTAESTAKVVSVVISLGIGVVAYFVVWAIQNSIARSEGYSGVTGAGAYEFSIAAGAVVAMFSYKFVLGIARLLGFWSETDDEGRP